MKIPDFYIDDLIKKAITEDINYIDVTTDYLIPDGHLSDAVFVSKDEGILCGIDIAARVFYLLDDRVQNNHIPVKQTNKVQFIKAGFVQRARFYENNKNAFASILCFGNYPPLYKTTAKVYTYFHQSLFLELPDDLSFKQKIIYGLKALILKIKIKNNLSKS